MTTFSTNAIVLAILCAVTSLTPVSAITARQNPTAKSGQLVEQMVQVVLKNGQVYRGRYDARSDSNRIRVRFHGNDTVLIKVFRMRDVAQLRPVVARKGAARKAANTTDARRALNLLFD